MSSKEGGLRHVFNAKIPATLYKCFGLKPEGNRVFFFEKYTVYPIYLSHKTFKLYV